MWSPIFRWNKARSGHNFSEYFQGKQTYSQLAKKYNCSQKTIKRCIDKASPRKETIFSSVANVVMDTIYFRSDFGVMVFKNSLDKKILLKKYVKNETIKGYVEGIQEIVRRGISVQAIVCDGRKGVMQAFPEIPVQMCQFHQVKIITRYLTTKPKLKTAIELIKIALQLVRSTEEEFMAMLDRWYIDWKNVLDERTYDEETKKSFFTHKPLRSAYRSLKNNLPHLFVFEH